MRRTTYERLRHSGKGGKIVFVGECPKYMDATETNEIGLYNDSIRSLKVRRYLKSLVKIRL